MDYYSLKMRASEKGRHISGAERVLTLDEISSETTNLLARGFDHENGKPDFLQIKVEKNTDQEVLNLKALPVSQENTASPMEGMKSYLQFLDEVGIKNGKAIMELLPKTYHMRGAMLLNVDTLEIIHSNPERGIRVTYMDSREWAKGQKNHFYEALILATKVAHCPNILGEICISDDPSYTTGYFASKNHGYVRLSNVKQLGSPNGGRIFLFRGSPSDVAETVEYLEHKWVLVDELPVHPDVQAHSGQDKLRRYEQKLDKWVEDGLERKMSALTYATDSTVFLDGKEYLQLSSNHYLNFSKHPEVVAFTQKISEKYGTGSGGSRLTTGNSDIHELLETALAQWKGTESALVFNSGYCANTAILQTLLQAGDVVLSDSLNHASIIDGCRFSKAEVVVYEHNNMDDLANKVRKYSHRQGIIVSDAVFSMDGDIANLPKLMEIAKNSPFMLMIDEAHSTGVLGRTGKGIVEHFNMKEKPDILMGTLSKAFGSEGGYICAKKLLIEFMKNQARGFIFTTALAPMTVASSLKALEILQSNPEKVQKLQANIEYFNICLAKNGLDCTSETAIFPIRVGSEKKCVEIAEKLFEEGLYLSPIRYPTVAKNNALLRVVVMSNHNKEQLKRTAKRIAFHIKNM